MGDDVILWNGCGITGQNNVELLQGIEMIAECHYRNQILCICFMLTTLDGVVVDT